jgi:FKBP-type peptidyl-prolyl cis-trans isomerase (trigger factor)
MTDTKKTTKKTPKDSTFTFKLSLKSDQIKDEYQKYLKKMSSEVQTKGFRKGRSPVDLVEQNISLPDVLSEIASHLISHQYSDKIKDLKLQPIIQPKIKLINPPLELDKDWQVEVIGCEKPVVTLSPNYKKEIKKLNSKKPEKDDNNKHLDQIITTLLKHIKVTLPPILIETDTSAHFNSLFAELEKNKTSLDQYLKSKKQTPEEYQKTIESQITKEWSLNLAIDQIAADEKITVTPDQVSAVSQNNPQFKENLNMVYFLILQQKVIKFLQDL